MYVYIIILIVLEHSRNIEKDRWQYDVFADTDALQRGMHN